MADTPTAAPVDTPAAQPQQTAAPAQVPAPPKKYTPELCADTIRKLPAPLAKLQTAFARPFDAFRKAFADPATADRIMAKEIDFAAQAMMANPYLIECAAKHPDDLVNALKNVAQSGLTLNPVLKLGYLVPYNGKIFFMASYMGQVSVLARLGLVCKVEAHPVFEGDEFVITYGTAEQLIHKPNPWGTRDKDHLKGCYYYMELANGKAMWDTMSVAEIEEVRRRSPSVAKGKSSPWDTDYIEMAKKTLIRRAFKVAFKHEADNVAESESKRKAITAAVDYDEQVEREWIRRKDAENAQKRGFYGDATTQADNSPFIDVEPIVD